MALSSSSIFRSSHVSVASFEINPTNQCSTNLLVAARFSGCGATLNLDSGTASKILTSNLSLKKSSLGSEIGSTAAQAITSSESQDPRVLVDPSLPKVDDVDGGGGGNGRVPPGAGGGSGGGHGGGSGGGEEEGLEDEFGPIMKFEEVMRESEARRVDLPLEMLEAAKSMGIRRLLLLRYLDLQGSVWPLGFAMRHCSMLRNRMLADPSFLFKVGTEVVIDSCCATFAEVQKRGKDFWAEFELYAADLLVGIVVDIAMVGMLAPYARFGQPSIRRGLLRQMQHACAALPSSVFEAERPGCRFSVRQRVATYFYKGLGVDLLAKALQISS